MGLTTLRLAEVGTLTARLGITYEERGLRYAMKGVGVEPSRWETNESSRKGRINFYDGLTPLVVASSARSWPGRVPKSLDRPLDSCRQMAAEYIPRENRELLERLAGYMFVCSPEHGMDIPVLADTMGRSAAFHELVPEDGELLRSVLLEYQSLRSEWERNLPLPAGGDETIEWPVRFFAKRIAALVLGAWSPQPPSAVHAPHDPSDDEDHKTRVPNGRMRLGLPDMTEFYGDDNSDEPDR